MWSVAPGTGRSVVHSWILTRLLLSVLAVAGDRSTGDLRHYYNAFASQAPLREYPAPVVFLLEQPMQVVNSLAAYRFTMIAGLVLADAAVTVLLARRQPLVGWWWVWLSAVAGPLMYQRFDVLVALVALLGLLIADRRPVVAGALLGIGTSWKYWPIVLTAVVWPHETNPGHATGGRSALVARRLRRLGLVAGACVAVFVATSIAVLATAGWPRLISPLRYQSARGLESEAVVATPLMILRLFGQPCSVGMSEFHAFEVFGPGVSAALVVAKAATVLAGGLILLLGYRFVRARVVDVVSVALAACAAVSWVLVVNTVLSPQYLLWLVAPASVLLANLPRKRAVPLVWALVAVLLLTHLEFPILGSALFARDASWLTAVATVVLAARNVLLIALAVWFTRETWRQTAVLQRQSPAGSAPGGQP